MTFHDFFEWLERDVMTCLHDAPRILTRQLHVALDLVIWTRKSLASGVCERQFLLFVHSGRRSWGLTEVLPAPKSSRTGFTRLLRQRCLAARCSGIKAPIYPSGSACAGRQGSAAPRRMKLGFPA
jgi:hypothetical protein